MDKTPQLVSGTDVFGPDSRFYYSIRTPPNIRRSMIFTRSSW